MSKTPPRARLLARCAILTALATVAFASPAHALGTAAGTAITNQATVNYRDVNNNALSSLSNIVSTTVSQVAAIDVSPDNSSNKNPSDVVYYAHIITNNGNGADTIDISAVSSLGWGLALYRDVNNDGAYTAGTDTVLTDTDADTIPDTGSVAANGTFRILVRVTVPNNAANAAVDVTTVTGTSSFNTGVSDNATDTTTVQAPVLGVVKSVAPLGNQPPGTQLTYTMVITNNGAATANQVVLTDPIPTNTTYVAASITYNAATRTDAGDADNADYNVSNLGKVTVNVGSMTPAQVVTITFKVTIN